MKTVPIRAMFVVVLFLIASEGGTAPRVAKPDPCMTKGTCFCQAPRSVAAINGPLVTTSASAATPAVERCPPAPSPRTPSAVEVALKYKGIELSLKNPPGWLLIVLLIAIALGALTWFLGDRSAEETPQIVGAVVVGVGVVGLLIYVGIFLGIRSARTQVEEERQRLARAHVAELQVAALRAELDDVRAAAAANDRVRAEPPISPRDELSIVVAAVLAGIGFGSWRRRSRDRRWYEERETKLRILETIERLSDRRNT